MHLSFGWQPLFHHQQKAITTHCLQIGCQPRTPYTQERTERVKEQKSESWGRKVRMRRNRWVRKSERERRKQEAERKDSEKILKSFYTTSSQGLLQREVVCWNLWDNRVNLTHRGKNDQFICSTPLLEEKCFTSYVLNILVRCSIWS